MAHHGTAAFAMWVGHVGQDFLFIYLFFLFQPRLFKKQDSLKHNRSALTATQRPYPVSRSPCSGPPACLSAKLFQAAGQSGSSQRPRSCLVGMLFSWPCQLPSPSRRGGRAGGQVSGPSWGSWPLAAHPLGPGLLRCQP